ncbi:YmaF family protein [Clostridium aminobutyricum]
MYYFIQSAKIKTSIFLHTKWYLNGIIILAHVTDILSFHTIIRGDIMPNNKLHTHSYAGSTTLVNRHDHAYSGKTSIDKDTTNHSHYIEGITSSSNGHTHHYTVQTSPAYKVLGGHYHFYRCTTDTDTHAHILQGYTSVYRDNLLETTLK